MEFKFTRFEVKDSNDDEWQEISENKALARLTDIFAQVTPELYKMLEGEEIVTPNGIYRVKEFGGFKEGR
jgi:hypothetical protein